MTRRRAVLAAALAALLAGATAAIAQFPGQIATGTVLGNFTGAAAPARPVALTCANLSDDGTACTANTGTSGTTLPFLDGANTWSGTQTFGAVVGTVVTDATTARTLSASDCGKTIRFTNAGAVAVEVPSTLAVGCHVALMQTTAGGQVTVSAGAGATFTANPHGYTKTFGVAAILAVTVYTTSTFTVLGDGA